MSTSINLIFSTIITHLKSTFARPTVQVVLFVQPFAIATTTYMVYDREVVSNFAAFVILGGGLSGIWSAITFSSAGDINRSRFSGTLRSLFASPASLSLVFSAKIVANAMLSMVSMAVSILYSLFILGIPFRLPHAGAFWLSLLAFLFGASMFALCLSNFFLLSRSSATLQNFLEYPLLMLGGIAFPIAVLPEWLQRITVILPMRWGSESLYMAFNDGELESVFYTNLMWTFVTGIVYYLISLGLFRNIQLQVREKATIELP